MYKSLLVLSLVFCFILPANAEQEKIWRIGIDSPYPPFAYEDEETGKLTGFDVDIANALCQQMNIKCDIQVIPFDNILPKLKDDTLDIAVAGLGTTPERLKSALFTDRYYRSYSIFIGKQKTITISAENLKGKKIGVQIDSLQEEYIKENYKDVVEIIRMNSIIDLIHAVQESKIDLAFVDGLPGYSILKTEDGSGLSVVGGAIELITGDSLIAVNKRHPEMVEKINQAIQALRQNGEYDKINRKYFDFNIY
ncbi:transporter substrate-binding domain-containing protein [Desulfovibrio litoralis]|uniref:Arginine/ornithine transport system substrate-binding protein n=1 Tax=Desulfovibrio litoralis DSM 11393 TaxID=1121455 RepID=A0A1M7S641_9BACT|nr:transporter substrate-binding domain-containing protein [Desulfovibrio litoralis]SHN53921.1 arginine/ornithine transport system substrate-binding protein [Desulfovibrio litoralis DSM 11393]